MNNDDERDFEDELYNRLMMEEENGSESDYYSDRWYEIRADSYQKGCMMYEGEESPETHHHNLYCTIEDESDDNTQTHKIRSDYLEEDKPVRFCVSCGNKLFEGIMHYWCAACNMVYKYDDAYMLSMLNVINRNNKYCPFCGSVTYTDMADVPWYMCLKVQTMLIAKT
jgi:NADH pyrophosphatase NudC (nudix superfamily)